MYDKPFNACSDCPLFRSALGPSQPRCDLSGETASPHGKPCVSNISELARITVGKVMKSMGEPRRLKQHGRR